MNDQERDELLIRVDQRTLDMKEKVDKFEQIIDNVKDHARDIKFIKWVGATAISIGGLLVSAFEYFKK